MGTLIRWTTKFLILLSKQYRMLRNISQDFGETKLPDVDQHIKRYIHETIVDRKLSGDIQLSNDKLTLCIMSTNFHEVIISQVWR
jgi:hypothetical protein